MDPAAAAFTGLLMALCCAAGVTAQEALPPPDSSSAAPGNTLVPLPALFYQPETGTGFGGLATYYFRPGAAKGRSVPPSEIAGSVIYTTRKQILTSLSTRLYLSGGALRLAGSVAFNKFPTKFWGIGNETPESAEEDYTPLTFAAVAEGLREVRRGWYVGARLQAAHRTLREVSDSGQLVTGTVPGSADGRIVEGTLLVTWDTRDNTIFPTRGRYHQLGLLGAATGLLSDFGYGGARLDAREYVSPARRHVLAFRVLGDARTGTPPFELRFTRPEIFRCSSDLHPFMEGWVVVQEHSYYALTGGDGRYELTDLPAGVYTLRAWHETLGEAERKIQVLEGEKTVADFMLGGLK